MSSQNDTNDPLVGTVKGPGERPHEFLFITADNRRARIGEFVYYEAQDGAEVRRILGNITSRRLVRNLPDAFLTPRLPAGAGGGVRLASSDTLSGGLSPRRVGEQGSAHVGSLLTRAAGEVPVVLSVKDVVSTHLAILASTGSGKSYTAGVIVEEMLMPHNRAAVLIVDPHGEYGTLTAVESDKRFAADDGYRPEVKIFTPDRVRVRFSSLTEADIKYLLPEGTSEKMLHYLSQA